MTKKTRKIRRNVSRKGGGEKPIDLYGCTNFCEELLGKRPCNCNKCIKMCQNINKQIDSEIKRNKKKQKYFKKPIRICKNNKKKRDIKKELRILKKKVLRSNRHLAKTLKKIKQQPNNTNGSNTAPKNFSAVTKKQLSKQFDSVLSGFITNCKKTN